MASDTCPEIAIPLSKLKVLLVALGALAFAGGSIWVWSIAYDQTRYNLLYVRAVAIAGVSLFGVCSVYGFFKVFDTRAGLIIDNQGIVDHSSAVAAGRVRWEEIVAVKVSEIAGGRFLTILVVDPQKLVDRGNFISRMLNAANTKLTGSPINIAPTSLCINFDELVRTVTEAFERHGRARRTNDGS